MPFQKLPDMNRPRHVVGPLRYAKQLAEKGYCTAVACEKLMMCGFSFPVEVNT